ncbi:hypothetical protein [Microbacterium maritypicum]|uniref:CBS domain-containing protein n=1 Tax=Microbacterium maritypicum MF109 TaxID=1333857 RepID=T5K4A9_MICMQ|nr:hypothetical protein [Microbacterium liquefaciens]EQM74711.1 hypothetical protein L687_04420 [Microbacterium maritypicum MF109]
MDLSPAEEALVWADAHGHTTALVARDRVLIGILSLADTIKLQAADVIAALHAQRLRTVPLTGDSHAAGTRILVRDDLHVIPDAIAISRKTLHTIRTNLGWAFGYNVAAIPIAAAVLLNPLIAAPAMSLSSVLVIYNSLRIQRVRSTRRH